MLIGNESGAQSLENSRLPEPDELVDFYPCETGAETDQTSP